MILFVSMEVELSMYWPTYSKELQIEKYQVFNIPQELYILF
jgi:hypothetical protein